MNHFIAVASRKEYEFVGTVRAEKPLAALDKDGRVLFQGTDSARTIAKAIRDIRIRFLYRAASPYPLLRITRRTATSGKPTEESK